MVIHSLSTAFALLALFLSLYALISTRLALGRAQKYVNEVHEYAKKAAERPARKQMAEIQAELTDLADSYASLIAAHKRLRSRIGMRELREKKKSSHNGAERGSVPQDPGQKAAYKQQFRTEMREKGMLR